MSDEFENHPPMPPKVYIMGKVTGEEYLQCYKKFEEREKQLKNMGYKVTNPMKIVPRDTDWITAMRLCLTAMLGCQKISPLADTWYSNGAMIEFNLSQQLKMGIVMPDK